jgi:hypothetical protein
MAATTTQIGDMQAQADAWNTRLIGYHDLNGFGDGMQVIKVGHLLYVAHVGTTPKALSVLDASDPTNLKMLHQLDHPPHTHRHKVQVVGDVLIQNNEPVAYGGGDPSIPPVTGIDIFSLADPTNPRKVGFHAVPGRGVHRMWFHEAPYAHVAAYIPGIRARGYQIVDLSDPADPRMAGAWWVPGSSPDDPDPWAKWDPEDHYQVHGAIPHGDRAYVSCTDAGMAIVDISDLANPRTVSHINWSPPYAGYSHTSLPLPGRGLVVEVCEAIKTTFEEDGDKRVWLIDVREERNPVMISSLPRPTPPRGSPWETYYDRPMRFGPHNVHENRPGSFQSETRIYSTWFNGGLRIHDISNADRPEEIGHFVPPTPPGQAAPQSNDLYVDVDGLIYLTDRITGGLYVVEYTGG